VRGRIDAVDEQIHRLLNERARLAQQVGISKAHDGRTVDFYRPEREAQVLRQARARNAGPLRDEEVLRLFREIMSACLAQQEPLKVAFLGPEGTFTQTAVLNHFGHSVRALPLASIDEVFHEVEAANADFGVVPIENSTEGTVNHTLDRFLTSPLKICGEVELRIRHQLMGAMSALSRIVRVCSHPQALAQCREWLEEHLPGVEQVPVSSNAEGARTGRQPTKRIGNYKDPVLKPWAAAQMRASNEGALSSVEKIPFAAQARCYPGGVPGQLLFPFEPLYFIQTPKLVIMMWQRDQWVRRVHMTDKHSENLKPSWFGESIGRYENGNTLVIDTIGLATKNSYIDNFRTPHSEKLHVVERLTLEPDGQHLTGIATVEDPDTFNAPLTMRQRWLKTKGSMRETICAENNFDYFNQGLFPIPTAEKPDF